MPFGYRIIKDDEYSQIIEQNNGMLDRINELDKRILELEAKEGARAIEVSAEIAMAKNEASCLQQELESVCANYNDLYDIHSKTKNEADALQAELNALRASHAVDVQDIKDRANAQIDKIQTACKSNEDRLREQLENTIGLAGASEAALEKRLREEFAETLAERDAELERSVKQASTLGYDNEQLQIQVCNLNNEVAALKRSESEKWEAAMSSQAEVIKLKAEIEKLTKKPAPRKRGGK